MVLDFAFGFSNFNFLIEYFDELLRVYGGEGGGGYPLQVAIVNFFLKLIFPYVGYPKGGTPLPHGTL
jgi:hypothetical protein